MLKKALHLLFAFSFLSAFSVFATEEVPAPEKEKEISQNEMDKECVGSSSNTDSQDRDCQDK